MIAGEAIPLPVRLRAVSKALRLLHRIAQRESTFAEYSGHLLLAFYLIGTTSKSAAIRRQALETGRERARYWKARWPRTRRRLNCDTVLQEVIGSYAAGRMGIADDGIRSDLRSAMAAHAPHELLYFDPAVEDAPDDVPEDCGCGYVNQRGRRRCERCLKQLRPRSKYELWYYALTNAYFCERHDMPLGVRFVDVVSQLPRLRPYPMPGTYDYYQSIYAVTHIVYTLNDYGRSRLSPRLLPEEFRFLKSGMHWALEKEEPDTIGEIIDSLSAFGVGDGDPLLVNGRRFLLRTQQDDGGWGGEGGDEYGCFHTVWTAIDGLRDYSWLGDGIVDRALRRALRGTPR